MPLYSTSDFHPLWTNLCKPPLLFRRRPPQSNYPPDIVLNEDNSSQLVTQIFKGGISRMAPTLLASSHHSLPPILHMNIQATVSSCSKGARGLSVFPRVGGIFTSTTISLDPSLRQLPSRYAIHAGRYLTDKEFRYLRTVIVTAAVYSGFDQVLCLRWHHQLTCCECGWINQDLNLSIREWTCKNGHVLDRDLNAAKNILKEGLKIYGQELSITKVERKSDFGNKAHSVKPEAHLSLANG